MVKDVSRAFLSTALNTGWKIVSGPLMMLLIPLFLSAEIQGYWYAFASLAALSVFADLGFTAIVLQFSAHEFAHLSYSRSTGLSGDPVYRQRLASLFRFVFRWVNTVTIVFFPVVFFVGVLLFRSSPASVDWFWPWILYSLGSATNCISNVLLSFIEGCEQVAVTQRIRFEMSVATTTVIAVALVLHLGLFALALSTLANNLFFGVSTYFRYRTFLRDVFTAERSTHAEWFRPFLRLMWRSALSYASGYFMFQLFTPVMFRFHGPVSAGKVGISISLWGAIFGVATSWITAVTPTANVLVAKKQWSELDRVVSTNIVRCLITFGVMTGLVFAVIELLHGRFALVDKIASRFMGPIALVTLGVGWTFQVVLNGLAVYLRAHKKEPFVATSLTSAVFISVATVLCAMFLPADWFFLGFAGSYLVVFPWIVIMFFNYRSRWHGEQPLPELAG